MELETMKKIIKKYEPGHSDFILRAMTAERYYKNETDILYMDKKNDEEGHPMRNADNRIPYNFHGLIVNQKAAYAFTAPPILDIGSDDANQKLFKALGDEYQKNCKELCVSAANASVAWVHYWKTEDGTFEWAPVDSKQIIPIWSKNLKRRLMGVLRVYDDIDEETGDRYVVYQYWTETECEVFRRKMADTVDVGLCFYEMFVDPENGEKVSEYIHDSGNVPFIPFFNNNIDTNDLKNIKPLIDVYDKVFSGFINDLDDVQELIFVISGYGGEDLNGFLRDLKKYKAIKIDGEDDAHSGVTTLNIEIPIEARNSVLEATRRAIFEQGQGFDPQPEKFGNQSGEALKFMYAMLEMKTGLMETEFRIGFAELARAACKAYGIQCDTVTQTWTRTRIRNDTELVDMCKNSVGIVSTKTILANHPFVDDVQSELKELEKEQQEDEGQAEQYRDAFGDKGQTGQISGDGKSTGASSGETLG